MRVVTKLGSKTKGDTLIAMIRGRQLLYILKGKWRKRYLEITELIPEFFHLMAPRPLAPEHPRANQVSLSLMLPVDWHRWTPTVIDPKLAKEMWAGFLESVSDEVVHGKLSKEKAQKLVVSWRKVLDDKIVLTYKKSSRSQEKWASIARRLIRETEPSQSLPNH